MAKLLNMNSCSVTFFALHFSSSWLHFTSVASPTLILLCKHYLLLNSINSFHKLNLRCHKYILAFCLTFRLLCLFLLSSFFIHGKERFKLFVHILERLHWSFSTKASPKMWAKWVKSKAWKSTGSSLILFMTCQSRIIIYFPFSRIS